MTNFKFGCKFVAFLIAVTLILNWQNVVVPIQLVLSQSPDGWTDLEAILGVLFLLINLLAAIGMYFAKNWGFVAAYFAVIYSNIFFSTSYIPFVSRILRLPWPGISLIIINSIVIAYVIYLHILKRKSLKS